MDKWIKENKITMAIVVVLAVVFGTGWFDKGEVKTVQMVSDLDLQTKCAAQTKSFFEQRGIGIITDKHTNHFNSKLNKCFLLTEHTPVDGFDVYVKQLFDVIEGNMYGNFSSIGTCYMYSEGNKNNLKACSTEGEFDAFVSGYMEN